MQLFYIIYIYTRIGLVQILSDYNRHKFLLYYLSIDNQTLNKNSYIFNELQVYSNDKKPNDCISSKSTEDKIIQWISKLLLLQKNDILFWYCNGLWVKIKIMDEQLVIKELWNHKRYYFKTNYCLGFMIVMETMDRMFELGFDSRDEYNILFDEYNLTTLKFNN